MGTFLNARRSAWATTATLLMATTLLAATLTGCSASADNGFSSTAPEPTDTDTALAEVPSSDVTPAAPADPEVTSTETSVTINFAETITFVPDPATAVTETVTADEGGSISLTSTDGTVFTLDMPAGALAEDTDITATIGSVTDGVVGQQALYSVKLEPEGTRFLEPAHLRIEPTTPLVAGHVLAFSTAGDGTDLRIGEIGATPSEILVPHFSIYNAALFGVSLREVRALFDGPKIDPERNLFNAIALYLTLRRVETDAGLPIGETEVKLQELLIEYQDKYIIPAVESSDGSCGAKLKISAKLIAYYQVVTANKISGVTSMKAIMQQQVRDAVATCEREFIALCKAKRDPQILINFWIRMYTYTAPAGVASQRSITQAAQDAKRICTPVYNVSGGGPEITVSGVIEDLGDAFILKGSFTGGTATFVYTPSDDRSGSYTVSGGGSGARLTGSGSYAISGTDEELIMTQITSSCVDVSRVCRDNTEVLTLTRK